MIQDIKQIGNMVCSSNRNVSGIVDCLTDKVPANKNCKKNPILYVIDLQTAPPDIKVKPKDLDDKVAQEYRWIGSSSSNSLQDRFTVNENNLKNLLTHTVPYFVKCHNHKGSSIPLPLKEKLARIFPRFFYNTKFKNDNRAKFVFDLSKFGWAQDEWNNIINVKNKEDMYKNLVTSFRKNKNIDKCATLFTLSIDGECMAKERDYVEYLYREIIETHFKADTEDKLVEQVCHLCGKKAPVTDDLTQLKKINVFINQKINFSSGVNGDFTKNYAVCKDCYQDLLVGERTVSKYFSSRILNESVFLIPGLVYTSSKAEINVEEISEKIREYTGGMLNVKSLQSVPKILRELGEDSKFAHMTILFVKKDSSSVKIKEAIHEVKPSRMAEIIKIINDASDWGECLFGGKSREYPWLSGLNDLNYLLPVRISSKENSNGTKVSLKYFKHLLADEKILSRYVISDLTKVARAIYYRNPTFLRTKKSSSNKYDRDRELIEYMLSSMVFLEFLRRLDMLEEKKGDEMWNYSEEEYPFKQVIEAVGFDNPKAALFLIGVLIARIGAKQYSASSNGKKTVLNMIDFKGMKISRIKVLSNKVFDKLKQYKLLDPYNERIFAIHKRIMDSIENWPLSYQENIYYILSGYAYETNCLINHSVSKEKGYEKEVKNE